MPKFVVCMDSHYVRDTQMVATSDMSDDEFENIVTLQYPQLTIGRRFLIMSSLRRKDAQEACLQLLE